MFSIRKSGAMALIIAVGMLTGCQAFHAQIGVRSPGPTVLNNTPISTDPAMDKRQWDVSQANYANDAVMAHPIYSPLQIDRLRYKGNAILEPVFFLVNIAYIPFGAFVQFPWTFEISKSVSAPPSYTLMPPLPDGPESVPTY